jgi:cation diffusion facilitator family transporter
MKEKAADSSPRRYALLAVAAAVVTIGLKSAAYALTGSVGMLSDAAESGVNLIAALVAFWALTVAALPPDDDHAYGHSKVEYFSSGVEGILILFTAVGIAVAAWERLLHPQPLQEVTAGLAVSLVATLVNGGVGLVLLRAGRRLRSITLEADASHLFTDVWTSVGVFVAVVLVSTTGWLILDPLVAFVVAGNILWTAYRLVRGTALGLLDTVLPAADREVIARVLAVHEANGIHFHAIRTRGAGRRRFVSLHVLAPGSWTIQAGHDLCEQVEREIRAALEETTVFTHLEPAEDESAYEDQTLDRA